MGGSEELYRCFFTLIMDFSVLDWGDSGLWVCIGLGWVGVYGKISKGSERWQ